MGVPRFKPPPRINYQTRSERISASSLSNARDRFCVVSLSPCDFFPEFLQVRYTGVNRERWWLRAMELFRSMGHSSMSIPRSRWNDRKFMEGERTRGWTKRETVYEFMTAARGLVRFISQYKFFFLSLSFYFRVNECNSTVYISFVEWLKCYLIPWREESSSFLRIDFYSKEDKKDEIIARKYWKRRGNRRWRSVVAL